MGNAPPHNLGGTEDRCIDAILCVRATCQRDGSLSHVTNILHSDVPGEWVS